MEGVSHQAYARGARQQAMPSRRDMSKWDIVKRLLTESVQADRLPGTGFLVYAQLSPQYNEYPQ